MTLAAQGSFAVTVFGVAVLAAGFLVCGVLWWVMVARPRDAEGRQQREAERDRAGGGSG